MAQKNHIAFGESLDHILDHPLRVVNEALYVPVYLGLVFGMEIVKGQRK